MPIREPAFLSPIVFDAANPVLRIAHQDGTTWTQDITIPVVTTTEYYLSGGSVDPTTNLITILQTALNTNSHSLTFTVSLSADGRNFVTIAASGGGFSLLWPHANTTLDATIFGFTNSGTQTGAATYTALYQTKGIWLPGTPSRLVAKFRDTRPQQVMVGHAEETMDGQVRGYDMSRDLRERRIMFQLVDRVKILSEESTGESDFATYLLEPYGSLEWNYKDNLWCAGRTVRFFEDKLTRTNTNYIDYRFTGKRGRIWQEMDVKKLKRYTVDFNLVEVA